MCARPSVNCLKEVRNILKDLLEFLADAFYCVRCYIDNLGGLKLGEIHFIFKKIFVGDGKDNVKGFF